MLRRHLLRAEEDGAGDAGDAGGATDDNTEDGTTILGDETSDDQSESDEGDDDKAAAKGEGEGSDEDGAEGEGDGEQDGDEKAGEFDVSKLEVPEGTEINEAWMNKLTSNESIQKLTQTDVQGLIGMVGEFVGDLEEARVTEQNARTKEWAGQVQDTEYVKEMGIDKVTPLALAARDEFFPDMTELFNETGLGSHPTMVVGMARIAEAIGLTTAELEGGGQPPGGQAKGSAAHRIFKDYAPGGKYASDVES